MNTNLKVQRAVILAATISTACVSVSSSGAQDSRRATVGGSSGQAVTVTDYFPAGFVADGSASYQGEIQRAVDDAVQTGRAVVFPPLTYRLDSPTGVRIASGLTLMMYGA